jgi:hypothetical protein
MWYCAWTHKQKPFNISSPIAEHIVMALVVNIWDIQPMDVLEKVRVYQHVDRQ